MTTAEMTRRSVFRTFLDYVYVLKPRETSLLVFIAVCAAIVAGSGAPSLPPFLLISAAVLLGSAGCNGATNYLDWRVDARMRRTCSRVLPSRRIYPPERVLPLVASLIVGGLALAWLVNPWCFAIGVVGAIASVLWRKTATCTYFGIIASISPVLIGWLAVRPEIGVEVGLLSLLVALWVPQHVWTIMIANREDYARAGLCYFPLNWKQARVSRILVGLSFALAVTSLVLYFVGDFGWLYLGVAVVLGVLMVVANTRLLRAPTSRSAWQVYKLSAFPYLGVVFIAMVIDFWLR